MLSCIAYRFCKGKVRYTTDMIIYIVRHGQSQANIGLTNNPDSSLTDLGHRQAETVANQLSGKGVSTILSSPFRRVLETAHPLCRKTNMKAEVFPDVCEWSHKDCGGMDTFVGRPIDEILAKHSWTCAPVPDIPLTEQWWADWPESPDEFKKRCKSVADKLISRFGDTDHAIAIFLHGATYIGLSAALSGSISQLSAEEMLGIIPNGHINTIGVENGKYQCL